MTHLAVHGLHKRYGPASALDGVGLELPAASHTAVVGPSGSGKSTLLRIIAGFETADAGRITLGGQVMADGQVSVPAHRRGIGYMPQEGALFPHLDVADNIGFGLARSAPGRAARIDVLMEMVELARSLRARRPHELSGGQQQRVALARALARQPSLMLLDEPFSALDTGLRESLRKTVSHVLRRAGITTLLVTHDQAEAMSFADHVAVLRDGRLAQQGRPQDLYLHPTDRETATFLGDAIVLDAELHDGWASCCLGRVETSTVGRTGRAEILVRPEHVLLTPASPEQEAADRDPCACYGEIVEMDFGGSFYMVEVALRRRTGSLPTAPDRLTVRSVSIDPPTLGGIVRIATRGTAHVLGSPVVVSR